MRDWNRSDRQMKWSECNYRISENADISTVCWQSQEVFILKIQNDEKNAAQQD